MKYLYLSQAFIIGYVVMTLEMLGGRIMSPYFGSGIHIWAAIITCMLFSLSIGYFCGGRLADKKKSSGILGTLIILSSLYILFFTAYYNDIFTFVYSISPDVVLGAIISSLAIVLIPIGLLGTYSPFAIRFSIDDIENSGNTSGSIYGISTIGSIIGTLVTTFVFIPALSMKSNLVMISLIGFVSGILFLIKDRLPSKKLKVYTNIFSLISLLIPILFYYGLQENSNGKILSRSELLKLKDGTIYQKTSNYNFLNVVKENNTIYLKHRIVGKSYSESKLNLLDPTDSFIYHKFLFGSTIYPERLNNVLILGMGGGVLNKIIHHYFPKTSIESVEIDSVTVDIAKKYFGFQESKSNKVFVQDARLFVAHNKKKYDLIAVDVFTGGHIPYHLTTLKYFKILKSRLTTSGCITFNLHSRKQSYPSILKTINKSLGDFHTYKSIKESSNTGIVACNKKLPEDLAIIDKMKKFKSIKELEKTYRDFLKLKVENDEFRDSVLLTDSHAPVNFLNIMPL